MAVADRRVLAQDAPISILHVIVGLQGGGAEWMLHRLVSGYGPKARFQHSVVSLTESGPVGDALSAAGVKVRTLGLRSALDLPRIVWALRSMIRARRPVIVQTWMYHADLLGGLSSRLAGNRRVIWGVRSTDMISGTARLTMLIRWICARLSRRIPATIVCAAETSRRAHVAIGYDSRRMVVIPNGFDPRPSAASARASLRLAWNLADHHVVIGWVGRFNPYKDPGTFVRAAGALAGRAPDCRFVVVGRGMDRNNAELSGWISDTGAAERFILLGERSDIPECLAAMDVFCLSSRSEGFPNVVGEAMSAALPCVVTNVGDAAVLIGDAGVVVPPEDAAALAEGLERLVSMPGYARRALGARARARVEGEFSMARARERFESVYESVTEAARG